METKNSQEKLEKIRSRIGFSHSFYVDPIGISGGLALWWDDVLEIVVHSSCKNIIDTLVRKKI